MASARAMDLKREDYLLVHDNNVLQQDEIQPIIRNLKYCTCTAITQHASKTSCEHSRGTECHPHRSAAYIQRQCQQRASLGLVNHSKTIRLQPRKLLVNDDVSTPKALIFQKFSGTPNLSIKSAIHVNIRHIIAQVEELHKLC